MAGEPVRMCPTGEELPDGRLVSPLPVGEGQGEGCCLVPAPAALFPDSFEHEADGVVPKGWSLGTVKDTFDLTMGQSPPGDTYNEDGNGIPFYQSRTFATLRDTLLPKLLSGELSVANLQN